MTTSRLLEPHAKLLHAFTDRLGGISTAPYGALNLAYHVGDDPEIVNENQRLLAERLGYDRHRLVYMKQIHSTRVTRCTAGMTFDTPSECDALITNEVGQPLMVMTADCTPILLYDPIHHAAAAVHAGRAGALGNIIGRTVEKMRDSYDTKTHQLLAVLGPSIHACCYEIGPEVAQEVIDAGYGFALSSKKERPHLDVNGILTTQLQTAGLKPQNVEVISACTSCKNETLFSYRAEGGVTGRQAGIIMLK